MRTVQIAYATIRRDTNMLTPSDFRTALRESWIAGEKATRYGRTWRLTERQTTERGLWGGKIGYVKDASLSRLYWDPKGK